VVLSGFDKDGETGKDKLYYFTSFFVVYNLSDHWIKLSMIGRNMEMGEGLIILAKAARLRHISPSKICTFLQIIRKANTIIILFFSQNNT